MSSKQAGPASTSEFEIDPQDLHFQSRLKSLRLVDSARTGLTGLALLCALVVLGTSGDSLAVYNTTHLPSEWNLPLWPNEFDLRPTVALVIGSAIVVLTSIVSLVFSKVQTVSMHGPDPPARFALMASGGRPMGDFEPVRLMRHS